CFFFQAEDGIRGFHVTGVQTCALPISDFGCAPIRMSAISPSLNIINVGIDRIPKRAAISGFTSILSLAIVTLPDNSAEISSSAEIGRASCRERAWSQTAGHTRRENIGW